LTILIQSVESKPRELAAPNQASARENAPKRGGTHWKSHIAGLAVFTVGLMWCVAGNAPQDTRIRLHLERLPGSSSMSVGTPLTDANGVKYYPIRSTYLGSQRLAVRVLEPTAPAPGKPRRLLFVLPVGVGVEDLSSTWSDGLEELRLLDIPNRFNMTLIAPSFSYLPWYGDNDLDQAHRMESFVVNDLVPFGDRFAKDEQPERMLIGFSKSGFGALDLILRHPTVFSEAAIWDSPAQLSKISTFPSLETNFGTQSNFDRYFIPILVSKNEEAFKNRTRLWIGGDRAMFTADMIRLHRQLLAAAIPHIWAQGGTRSHSWSSGWLSDAVSALDAMSNETPPDHPLATNQPRLRHVGEKTTSDAGGSGQ
jgi:esterase/lipase superfamily enzyme